MSKPWIPHEYQKEGIKFMVSRACAAIFWDPGMGKSSVTFAAFKLLKSRQLVSRMLIVAPLRPCYSVWPREAEKWDNFKHLRIGILHGPDKEKVLRSKCDVYVINPEGLPWLREQDWDLPEMLVVDESTRFKHTDTQRFKILKPMLPKFQRRYILTGSPAPNGLLDLFGQVFILDLGGSLGQYITHFRLKYFDHPLTGSPFDKYKWIPQRTGPARIYEKLKPLAMRMAATDYLQLPELIYNTVEVDLPESARKVYKDMEDDLIVALKNDKVIAANAAAATNKCRQIANGGIYLNDGEKWKHIHEAKVDATEEIVEELSGKPALIAYEYQHDLERLRKRFGKDTPHIGGGVPAKRFREIEAAWNEGEIPVLLAQPQSVAHGLNLQGTGAAVIWHSITWNLEDYEQFIRRVWRQGQTERIVVHHIVARDTVDEAVMKMLRAKDRTQTALLKALKDYVRIE